MSAGDKPLTAVVGSCVETINVFEKGGKHYIRYKFKPSECSCGCGRIWENNNVYKYKISEGWFVSFKKLEVLGP